MILAGDVGGTSTRLAFFEEKARRLVPIAEDTVPSRDHPSLGHAARHFLASHSLRATSACFGIAGPVKGGRVRTTNLPWVIDAAEIAGELGLRSVTLINDLEANAWGLAALGDEDFALLNAGETGARGNAGVIAAGTGLGEAGLYWDGESHHPFACEGGHTDFAPRDPKEAGLLRHLLTRFERVSYERVLSGPGLHNIYIFLSDERGEPEPAWLAEEMRTRGAPAAIADAGLAGRSGLCAEALDLFVAIYGAEAGNLALKMMATGGMYVGGGIAPRILPRLTSGLFMEAFTAKGRMAALMAAIPVRVVLNDRAALLGAARHAMLHPAA